MRGPFGARLIDSVLEQFGDEQPPVFTELCHLYVEHHEKIADLLDEGERTVIHGDTHAGNHFIEGDDVGFYDWAVLSRSPGIRDVAIHLGNSCPTEVRRANQEEWLRRGTGPSSSKAAWTLPPPRCSGIASGSARCTRGSRRPQPQRWGASGRTKR